MLAMLLPALAPILERLTALIPDPEARAKAAAEAQAQLMAALTASDAAQSATNTAEAANGSLFVGGARPFLLWVCGFGYAYQYLLRPLLPWCLEVAGHAVPALPALDGSMAELTFGMLGLAGWRTLDKIKGVETISVRPYENARGR